MESEYEGVNDSAQPKTSFYFSWNGRRTLAAYTQHAPEKRAGLGGGSPPVLRGNEL